MKNVFTRAAALAAALCLVLTTGCKSKNDSSSIFGTSDNIGSELSDLKYTAKEFKLPDGINSVYLYPSSDYKSFIGADSNKVYNVSADLKTFSEIKLEFPDEFTSADAVVYEVCASQKGEICVIATLEDHGGLKPPAEHDDSFDYAAYYENSTAAFMLMRFDNSGKLISKAMITGCEDYVTDNRLPHQSIVPLEDGSALMLTADSNVAKIDTDGKFKIVYEPNSEVSRAAFVHSGTGQLLLCYVVPTEDNERLDFRTFDTDECNTGSATFSLQEWGSSGVGVPADGTDGCWVYLSKKDGLHAIMTDSKDRKILDWEELGLSPLTVIPLGSSKFLGIDYRQQGRVYYMLEPVNGENEADTDKEPQTMTLAVFGSEDYKDIVEMYNRSQRDYRVRMVDYKTKADISGGVSSMDLYKNDIASGSAPDVVIGLGHESSATLSRHGAFADLYEFMAKDSEINRDTLLPNILQACENSKGQLFYIPESFHIETTLIKKKFHDKATWTLDDLLNLYENPPVNAEHMYDDSNRCEFIETVMLSAASDLIDFDKGTCDLNNDKFIRLIKLCKRFPDHVVTPSDYGIDADTPQSSAWYKDKFTWLDSDRTLIERLFFNLPSEHVALERWRRVSEPVTLAGYPTEDGNGSRIRLGSTLSINAASSNKGAAWQFIRYMLTYDFQTGTHGSYDTRNIVYWPVNAKAFDKWLDGLKTLTDYNGNTGTTIVYDDIFLNAPTQADVDDFKEYIMGCHTLMPTYFLSPMEELNDYTIGISAERDVYIIITEEVYAFLAGEITAEQAADYIQQRASLVVSENAL